MYIYDENDEIIIEEYPLLRIAQLGAPTVEIIDGVPDEPVYAASKMPIKVEVSNLNPEKTYFVSTGMVRSGLITGKESVELTLAHRALEFPGEAEVTVTLYEVTALTEGGEIDEYEDVCESGTKEYEVMERVSVKLDFTLMEEAVVGQAYPFSVTVTNHSDEDLSNLCLNSYSPRHILEVPWKAEFAYELQDGMEQNEEYSGMVYLPTLKAGETITVKGTITWPKNAAGDASFLVVSVESVEDGENYQLAWADKGREEIIRIVEKAGAGSQPGTNQPGTSQPETNQNGNGQAGGNQNAQNNQSTQNNVPKTGDTASVTGTMAALLVAAAAIVAVMKKRTHML